MEYEDRVRRAKIVDEGYKANMDYCQDASECPYPEDSKEMEWWLDGWYYAQDDFFK